MSRPVFRRRAIAEYVKPESDLRKEAFWFHQNGSEIDQGEEGGFKLKTKQLLSGIEKNRSSYPIRRSRSVMRSASSIRGALEAVASPFERIDFLSTPLPSNRLVSAKTGAIYDEFKNLGHRTMRLHHVPWTAGCTDKAIIQLGPTCLPSTLLNLVLSCELLRNYCIRFIRELFRENPGMQKTWNLRYTLKPSETQTSSGIGFHMHILHGVYRRLCASEGVKLPEDPSFAPVCALEDMLRENVFYLDSGVAPLTELIGRIGLRRFLKIESIEESEAAGWGLALADRSSLFGRPKTPLEIALDKHKNSVLLAAVIYFYGDRVRTSEEEESDVARWDFVDDSTSGHAVLGVVCADGSRHIFDSNHGDVNIDWKSLDFFEAYLPLIRLYGYTNISIERRLIFCSRSFEKKQKKLGPASCF